MSGYDYSVGDRVECMVNHPDGSDSLEEGALGTVCYIGVLMDVASEKGFVIHLAEVGEGDHIHCFVSAPPS